MEQEQEPKRVKRRGGGDDGEHFADPIPVRLNYSTLDQVERWMVECRADPMRRQYATRKSNALRALVELGLAAERGGAKDAAEASRAASEAAREARALLVDLRGLLERSLSEARKGRRRGAKDEPEATVDLSTVPMFQDPAEDLESILLRLSRAAAASSQGKLAAALGVSQSAMSYWLSRKRKPRPEQVRAILETLDRIEAGDAPDFGLAGAPRSA